jgi:hypothetical protein
MDLPALAYAAATRNAGEVIRLMTNSDAEKRGDVGGFCNQFLLATMVRMQRILGTMSRKDAKRWLDWSRGSDGTMVDAVKDPDDALPASVDVAHYLLHCLRHPRSFVVQYGLEDANADAIGREVADELSH